MTILPSVLVKVKSFLFSLDEVDRTILFLFVLSFFGLSKDFSGPIALLIATGLSLIILSFFLLLKALIMTSDAITAMSAVN